MIACLKPKNQFIRHCQKIRYNIWNNIKTITTVIILLMPFQSIIFQSEEQEKLMERILNISLLFLWSLDHSKNNKFYSRIQFLWSAYNLKDKITLFTAHKSGKIVDTSFVSKCGNFKHNNVGLSPFYRLATFFVTKT